MTLRRKSLLLVLGTAAALVVALGLAGRRVILAGARAVERELVAADVLHLESVLLAEQERIASTAGDWAFWDDTYRFAADRNEAFVGDNLSDEAVLNLKVNFVAILDPAGGVLFAKALDLGDGSGLPHGAAEIAAAVAREPRVRAAGVEGAHGILALPRAHLLVAARPILRDDRSGPVRGTVVFGRFVDPGRVARAARIVHLEVWLRGIDDPALPHAAREALRRTRPEDPAAVVPLGLRTVGGYLGVRDAAGATSLVLGLVELRAVYVQAVKSLVYFLSAAAVLGAAFCALVAVLLERLVLARLTRLSDRVREIGGERDPSRRLAEGGDDEIGSLAREVNGMLAQLEEAQGALQRSRDELERRVSERTSELEEANVTLHAQMVELLRAEEAIRTVMGDLERQNEALRKLDRMKDALIADVSHELRTPVAKHAMQLELLRAELERRGLAGELGRILDVMTSSVQRQQRVIRNILTLARIEGGRAVVSPAPLRLDELVSAVVADCRALPEAAEVAIEVRVPPLTITSDRDLLWHVFANLVGNAIKYRSRTAPRVEVTARREDGGVRLRVEDNGVGFSRETGSRIFERFYQESATVDGIGLGLHIVRAVLDRLGGTVTLESPGPGLGAVAELTLPIAPPPAPQPAAHS